MRNRSLILWAAAWLLLFSSAKPVRAQGSYGTNLVQDGGFEASGDDPNTGAFDSRYWGLIGIVNVFSYSSPPLGSGLHLGFPPSTPDKTKQGLNFFAGGNDSDATSGGDGIVQTVNVAGLAGDIDGGTVTYNVSAWLGGQGNIDDYAYVRLDFVNGSGQVIGSGDVGLTVPVDSAARGNNTEMLARSSTGKVPAKTRSINVVVGAARNGSNAIAFITAYADNVSLTLSNSSAAPNPLTGSNTFDLKGDGNNDLLWQNSQNGDIAVWYFKKTVYQSGDVIQTGVAPWKVVGIADFNGDKKPDFLLQNTKTGDVVVWYMNGKTVTGYDYLYKGVPLTYVIVGTPDLNGDGKPDVLFQNTQTGNLSYWLMNGAKITSGATINPLLNTSRYQLLGTGDFTGDGKPDFLFRDTQTGDVTYWQMNGILLGKSGVLAAGIPLIWTVGAITDMDGDGKLDLVWRNTTTGDVAYWQMLGTTLSKSVTLYSGVPSIWSLVGPR